MAISAEEIRRMRAEEEHARRNSKMTAPDSYPVTEEDPVGEGSSYPNAKARADVFGSRGDMSIVGKANSWTHDARASYSDGCLLQIAWWQTIAA